MTGKTTETITIKHAASHVAGRRAPNLPAAIYGTIVATAIVAGLGERTSTSPTRALWILLASGLFFWAAHVYASLLAQRIQGMPTTWAEIRLVVSRDWPLFYACFPLAVPLVLALLGVLAGHMALGVATFIGVVTLAGWGVAFSRRAGYGPGGVVAAASVNAAIGLFIVGLKVAVR